jgi:hypothetical protein
MNLLFGLSRWPRLFSFGLALLFLSRAVAGQRTAFGDEPVGAFGKRGLQTWSRHAYALPQRWDAKARPFRIASPDSRYILLIRGRKTDDATLPELEVLKARKQVGAPIPLLTSPEVIWSPDSSAFVLTWTDGGLTGNWRADIYRIEAGGVRKLSYEGAVRRDLAAIDPPCVGEFSTCNRQKMMRDLGWVNVVAIRWLDGGRSLALLAAVPNSSRYGRNMARTRGYVVDSTSGTIHKAYSRRGLQRVFGKDLNTIVP